MECSYWKMHPFAHFIQQLVVYYQKCMVLVIFDKMFFCHHLNPASVYKQHPNPTNKRCCTYRYTIDYDGSGDKNALITGRYIIMVVYH